MLSILHTAAIFGVEAQAVQVEVDVSDGGLPAIVLVGLPDTSVRESRDRVQSAIRNSGFEFPRRRVTVNLAPADVRKVGSAFDLPIGLGILAASGGLGSRTFDDTLVVGELSLDGAVRPVRGVLPIAVRARADRRRRIILPTANAAEATIVSGLDVVGVDRFEDAVHALEGRHSKRPMPLPHPVSPAGDLDLSDVRGQLLARRAVEIAAAGGHNLLLCGPPGAGKSMLARRLPGIMPTLTHDEALEATSIHSVAGLLPRDAGLLTAPPFRAPHHTASTVALVGGGPVPRPGEISLAHHGVLLLDETAEFARHSLDALRQPLEEGVIRIARAARTATLPARFLLAATTNPCPCGFLGDDHKECRCTPQALDRYRGRLSGPLRDRIDLSVWVRAVPFTTLRETAPGETSASVRHRVAAARKRQSTRNPTARGPELNARLQGRALTRLCRLDQAGVKVLDAASRRFHLSARSCHRVMKVARTIADLDGVDQITAQHVAEAVQFRLE